jgi:microcystin-dependent protein
MQYHPPINSLDPDATYVDGSLQTGTEGSIPPAKAIEDPQRSIVNVIEAAGLTPADDITLLEQAIAALIANQVVVQPEFVGQVAYFSSSTAPSGWFKANGAAVSRTTYADLFSAIGTAFGAGDGSTTFQLPDLRGEFLRALDDGRGLDAGRTFGSTQKGTLVGGDWDGVGSQTLGAVSTTNPHVGRTHVGADDIDPADYPNMSLSVGVNPVAVQNPTSNTNQFGSTRPRNIALLACIKY